MTGAAVKVDWIERHRRGERLDFLDSLRAVAVLLVVGIHSIAYMPLADPVEYWVGFITRTVAVPAFFLCDGFLLTASGASRATTSRCSAST